MTRLAPRDAALHPASRATASPGVAFASSATVDPAKASGLTMVIAAGLWIFVLVRRRWPERT